MHEHQNFIISPYIVHLTSYILTQLIHHMNRIGGVMVSGHFD